MRLVQAIEPSELIDSVAANEYLVDEAEYFFGDGVIAVVADEFEEYLCDGWSDSSAEVIHLYDEISVDDQFLK